MEGYRYLYLYNTSAEKYENLKVEKISDIQLNSAGTYLITDKKLNGIKVSLVAVILCVIVLLGLAGAYIAVKKKHWFW